MGIGSLPTATDGNKIPASHNNAIKDALTANLVPRNTAGNATDVAGSFGTSTYRWIAGFFRRLFIGTAGSSSNNIKLHRGGNAVLQVLAGDDTTDDGVESINIAQIDACASNRAIPPASIKAGRSFFHTVWKALFFTDGSNWHRIIKESFWGPTTSGQIIPVPNTGVWTDIPNNSVSVTTNGLPIFFTCLEGYFDVDKGSAAGTSGSIHVRLLRGTTQVGFSMPIGSSGISLIPVSCCSWHDVPSPGTYTYKLQVMSNQAGAIVSVIGCRFFGKEF